VRYASAWRATSVVATGGKYYAGGTNLLDLMKGGVEEPASSSIPALRTVSSPTIG
jgi:CO/xanthine dehydrogenase FAD-binding subunit